MPTLTPKLGLKKPIVNVETDWGSRVNETIDILDDAVLAANTLGKGTVIVTDDGAGNLTISGTPHPIGSGTAGVSSITTSGVTITGAVVFGSLDGIILIPDLGTKTITFSGTPHLADQDTIPDAIVGADGITVISGADTTTVSGFYVEFVATSGSLQTQIDAVEAGDVDSVNAVTGSVLVTGTQNTTTQTAGQTITITGPDLSSYAAISDTDALAASGVATDAAVAINAADIAAVQVSGSVHADDVDAHHTRYTKDENDAIVGLGEVVVTSGAGVITISGTPHPADQDTISDAIVGVDGITVISGANTTTVSGFRTEFVSTSGSLQSQIDAVEGSDVDSINSVTGDVTITGSSNFPIRTEGQVITVSGADFIGNMKHAHDGGISGLEAGHDHAYTVTSNGSTITFTFDREDGDPVEQVQISGSTILHAVPDTVALTPAGTDTNPQENWVYLLQSGDSLVLTKNTTGFPAFPHARIARVIVQTASGVQTNGPLKLHAYTDHVVENDSRGSIGHIHAIGERIRAQFAEWQSGTALTYTEDAGPTPDDITIQLAAGVVYQLHTHATPALDTSGSDVIFVVNDGSTPYTTVQSLSEITEYSDGSPVGIADRFNVVIWGAVAENDSDTKLFLNMPSEGYNNDTTASNDSANTALYTVPRDYAGVGWLLARLTVKRSGGGNTWTIINNHDLRGATPSTFPGGIAIGGGGVTDHGLLTGLTDDDHTQYSLVSGTRSFTGVVGGITPTVSAHLATKGYVDTDTSALAASGVATDANVATNAVDIAAVQVSGSTHAADSDIHPDQTAAESPSGIWDFSNGLTVSGQPVATGTGGGDAGTLDQDFTVGQNLSAGDVVVLDSSGNIIPARADSIDTLEAIGCVTSTVSTGQTATVRHQGNLDVFSGLTAGEPLFLSPTISGAVSGTPPSTEGTFILQVGQAVSSTEIYVDVNSATAMENTSEAIPVKLLNVLSGTVTITGAGTVETTTEGQTITVSGSGVIDHGGLTGLGDDDHPQYGQLADAESAGGVWNFSSGLAVSGALDVTGVVKLSDGTAAAPSIAFASDTDTGLFRSSNGVGIADEGNKVARFTRDSGITFWQTSGETLVAEFTSIGITFTEFLAMGTNKIVNLGAPTAGTDAARLQDVFCIAQTKSITVEDPTASEDLTMFFAPDALTVSGVRGVVIGSSTPSATVSVKHSTDRTAAGNNVLTAATAVTGTITGQDLDIASGDVTIPASSWVWLETSAESGTTTELHVTLKYTIDS